jgi:protocatechuate 3,4-dioxygenase beta subunit
VIGSVSLGGVLAACGGEGNGASQVTTTDGATAGVEPKTSTSRATARLFDRAASCSLTPQETEGPYYFDVESIRSDIREDRPGIPLTLALRVRGERSCKPVENAVVEIWHCDALGVYSGFEAASRAAGGGGAGGAGPPGASSNGRTDKKTYLRGAQVTNADGIVQFKTIYPGWYTGRTVHIHAKVHLDKQTVLTTQLFFDDAMSGRVYDKKPYSGHSGRDTFNDNDTIFDKRLLVTLERAGGGYLAVMGFDVQPA